MTVDFFIIGAQKAATSTLQALLRTQDLLYMPTGESPILEEPEYHRAEWKQIVAKAPPGVLVGGKRPDYLCSGTAPGRAVRLFPEMKLIAVLREPVSRSVSAYYHLMRHGHLPVRPLNTGMSEAIRSFRAGEQTPSASVISNSLYGRGVGNWLAHFPPEQLLILSHEDVGSSPGAAIVEVGHHLGVELALGKRPKSRAMNQGTYHPFAVALERKASLLRTIPMGEGMRRRPHRNPVRRYLGASLGLLANRRIWRENAPEALDVSIRHELEDLYRSDATVLERHVGQSIRWS